MIDQLCYLLTQNVDGSDKWFIADIIASLIILGFIVVDIANTKELFFKNFSENN